MKKTLVILAAILCCTLTIGAQGTASPQAFTGKDVVAGISRIKWFRDSLAGNGQNGRYVGMAPYLMLLMLLAFMPFRLANWVQPYPIVNIIL